MSVSSTSPLLNTPPDLLYHIISYCTLSDILSLETAGKAAKDSIKNIWLQKLVERNLFIGMTFSRKFGYTFYTFTKTEKKETTTITTAQPTIQSAAQPSIELVWNNNEVFQPGPVNYLRAKNLSIRVREYISMENKFFIERFLLNGYYQQQQALTQTHATSLCLSEEALYRRLYLQISEQDLEISKDDSLKNIHPTNLYSLDDFFAAMFRMQDHALEKSQEELFSLLDYHYFARTLDNPEEQESSVRGYIRHCNYLLFNEIQRTRPLALQYFCNVLAEHRPTISLTNLFDTSFHSFSQEEDKKVSEEEASYVTTTLNLKFQPTFFKDWPICTPPEYEDRTPLEHAIIIAHKASEKLSTFQNTLSSDQKTNFEKCLLTKNLSLGVVKVLIDAKANVNEPCFLYYMIKKIANLDILKVLIECGANVNQSTEGYTILGAAVYYLGSPKHSHPYLTALLAAKADVNGRDALQRTPLMIAAETSNPETVQLLLDYGADFSAYDTNGDTCLSYGLKVERNVQKVKMLLSYEVRNSSGVKKRIARMLPADVNRINANGLTALALAIMHDKPGASSNVRLLMDAGADPELLPEGLQIPHRLLRFIYPKKQTTKQKGIKRKNQN